MLCTFPGGLRVFSLLYVVCVLYSIFLVSKLILWLHIYSPHLRPTLSPPAYSLIDDSRRPDDRKHTCMYIFVVPLLFPREIYEYFLNVG